MSLINEMLKDLERQKDQLVNTAAMPVRSIRFKGVTVTALLIGLAIGGAALNQSAQAPNRSFSNNASVDALPEPLNPIQTAVIPTQQQSTISVTPTPHQSTVSGIPTPQQLSLSVNTTPIEGDNTTKKEPHTSGTPIIPLAQISELYPHPVNAGNTPSQQPQIVIKEANFRPAQTPEQSGLDKLLNPDLTLSALIESEAASSNTKLQADEITSHNTTKPDLISSQNMDPHPSGIETTADAITTTEAKTTAKKNTKTKADTTAKTNTKAKADTTAKADAKAKAETTAKSKTKAKAETTAKTKTNPKADPKAKDKTKTTPKTTKTSKKVAESAPSINTEESDDTASIKVIHRPLSADQQSQRTIRIATNIYKEGNFSEAERMLEELLAQDNAQHKARLLLAKLYAQENANKRAVLVLSNGLLHYPQHAPYASLYAQILAEQGRDGAAIDVLQNALLETADNADLHALLAGLYQRTGNSTAASESYLIALGLEPKHGEWWMGLGISSEQAGDRITAENAYNEALQFPLASAVEQYAVQRLQQLVAKKAASKNQINQ